MSFEVTVETVDEVSEHPNADKLELLEVDGKQICAGIGEYEKGDRVAFIPPDSLVPQSIQEELGVENYLNNKRDNMGRTREVRLRDEKSEGLLYPARDEWEVGQDVSDELGIEEYQVPVPTQLRGEVNGGLNDLCISYDANNYRRHPDVFDEEDEVVFMEKIHGMWCQMGVLPDDIADEYGVPNLVVASKGLASKGQPFKPNVEANEDNTYLRKAKSLDIVERLKGFAEASGEPVYVLGEIFGDGVQFLDYGATTKYKDEEIGFRVFDVYHGMPGEGGFFDFDEMEAFCSDYGLDVVPVLYRGKFHEKLVPEYRGGLEQVSGEERHMREGIVIRSFTEQEEMRLPNHRKQLKAKSYDYLMQRSDINEEAVRTHVIKYNDCYLGDDTFFTDSLGNAGLVSEDDVEDRLEAVKSDRPELNEDKLEVESVKVTYKRDGRLRNEF